MAGNNLDLKTVQGFGDEWSSFDQSRLIGAQYDQWFDRYFAIFPFDSLPPNAEGFDLGCGSGRWALGVAPKVGTLHCVDPAAKALDVAKRRLANYPNVDFHLASANALLFASATQDFGYSLGVLHHVPNTLEAMRSAVATLKPSAPFLVYLYYALDDRPGWFRTLWRATDLCRLGIARLPFTARRLITDSIAFTVYWPLSRAAAIAERLGANVANFPLAAYRGANVHTLRTDALDRFGTRLEQRFTRSEIEQLMISSGLENIRFSDREPYWVAVGTKRA